jgi:hypothetical protein
MITTFGKMPTSMPAGFFKAVRFPVLAMLDTQTGDHRKLLASGAGTRDLPLSIKYATKTSAMGGHDGAEVSGTLFEMSLNPESGKMSGQGFLLDDEHGRRHARLIHLAAMRGNSVDLAEVKARLVEDFESEDYWIEFYEFKLAATTGVTTPAFAEAHAEVDALSDDELTASFMVDPMAPLIVQEPEEFNIVILGEPEVEEVTASAGHVMNFDIFHLPEADVPTKITVAADGVISGHLALWDTCHDGYADQCLRVPRPSDNYASFNKPGVLTDRGIVETGPIFALGGHRPAKSAPTIDQAYGGIENAWADVRITVGMLGPWLSGRVRPGVSDDLVYAARASRISGHWVQGKLKAIVSVNAEGYDVPGSGEFNVDFSTGFSYATNDDGVAELVASFPACMETKPTNQLTFTFTDIADPAAFASAITEAVASQANTSAGYQSYGPITLSGTGTTTRYMWTGGGAETLTVTTPVEAEAAEDETVDNAWADDLLANLLDEDDDS